MLNMLSFTEYSHARLDEAVADHARVLMATGKYDPAVRGSATKFKSDLKLTGATSSDMTAQDAWSKHKHLHAGQVATTPSPVKAAPAKATADAPELVDARKVRDHARGLGYNAHIRHDGFSHTVALGWNWDSHKNAGKLDAFIHKNNLYHVDLAAEVHGQSVKTVQ